MARKSNANTILDNQEVNEAQNAIVTATGNGNNEQSPGSVEQQTQTACQNGPPKRHEAMSTKDFKMARVLLSIVLVFFVCHLPR